MKSKINLKTYTYKPLFVEILWDAPLFFMVVCRLPKWGVAHRKKNPAKWVVCGSSKMSAVEDLHNVSV